MSGAERPLAGQFAAVTGGSKGIGLGIARRFVQAGASVVLLARSETTLEEACDSLKAEIRADEQVHWIAMDTSRRSPSPRASRRWRSASRASTSSSPTPARAA